MPAMPNAGPRKIEVGDLRPSQLLRTFGVGSLVDLPNLSVLVMGLDEWDSAYRRPITEERLLAILRGRLGPQVNELRLPPRDETESVFGATTSIIGVPVAPFPRWMRCPRCDLLAPVDSGLFQLKPNQYRPDRTRYVHGSCNRGNEPAVLPVRFLVACSNGHLDDFPWVEFVHGGKCECQPPVLRFRERDASGEATDIVLKCDTCGRARSMGQVMGQDKSGVAIRCTGRHPHLRSTDDKACDQEARVILIGASNSWFPVTLSVLSLPESSDKIRQAVSENWAKLEKATSREVLSVFRGIGALPALAEFSEEEIWEAVEAKR